MDPKTGSNTQHIDNVYGILRIKNVLRLHVSTELLKRNLLFSKSHESN